MDARGTVKQVPKGTMCLLHGFDGVHAGTHRPEYLHGAFADSFRGVGAVDATGKHPRLHMVLLEARPTNVPIEAWAPQ